MECRQCGSKVMVTDEECPSCGRNVLQVDDPPSPDLQKVTNMMGKGKPITAIVPKEHIVPGQFEPFSGTPGGAATAGTKTMHVSATLTGSMIIGMIAAVILFGATFLPVVGVKIDFPGMANVFNK